MASERNGVTVVIPTHNRAELLDRALRSVLAQTLPASAIVVVDDASTDGTGSVVQRYADSDFSTRIRYHRNATNAGPSKSRNVGWDSATTEWVAFLDSDDAWAAHKLESQLAFMRRLRLDASCHFSHGHRIMGEWVYRARRRGRPLTWRNFVFSNCVITSSVMVRNNVPLRFPEAMRLSEDLSLWLDLVVGYRMGLLPVRLVTQSEGDQFALTRDRQGVYRGAIAAWERVDRGGPRGRGWSTVAKTILLAKSKARRALGSGE